jgi:hypothetical protein
MLGSKWGENIAQVLERDVNTCIALNIFLWLQRSIQFINQSRYKAVKYICTSVYYNMNFETGDIWWYHVGTSNTLAERLHLLYIFMETYKCTCRMLQMVSLKCQEMVEQLYFCDMPGPISRY